MLRSVESQRVGRDLATEQQSGCNRPHCARGPVLSLTVVSFSLKADVGEDPVHFYLSPEPNSVLHIDT